MKGINGNFRDTVFDPQGGRLGRRAAVPGAPTNSGPEGQVQAYELLFRAGPETVFRGDPNKATSTVLDNVAMFGLEKLAGGLPAFVNCTPGGADRGSPGHFADRG